MSVATFNSSAALLALAPWRREASHKPLPCSSEMRDGVPFLTSSSAVLCLVQKVGSTSWKLLLLRGSTHLAYHSLKKKPHGAPAPEHCLSTPMLVAPRFLLIRNPYSRLLSGFLDKCLLQSEQRLFPNTFNCTATLDKLGPIAAFAEFVEIAMPDGSGPTSVKFLNPHFSPQVDHCSIRAGYDFYLPVEQMPSWYAPFVAVLGLEQVARSGWNVTTKWWSGADQECFYTLPGRRCDGSLTDDGGEQQRPASFHATSSNAQLGKYYTPRLARLVTAQFSADLEQLRYPEWDGIDASAYLARVSSP